MKCDCVPEEEDADASRLGLLAFCDWVIAVEFTNNNSSSFVGAYVSIDVAIMSSLLSVVVAVAVVVGPTSEVADKGNTTPDSSSLSS